MGRPLIVGIVASALIAAQAPRLDDVLVRLGTYLERYEGRLALLVAEERYQQSFDLEAPRSTLTVPADRRALPVGRRETLLRSDYALTRASDKDAWVGYRDTFEVNGKPIRDREDRLQRLLIGGGSAGAARIAEDSSRFNLASTLVTRNINVPTLVLEMLHPRNQSRFTFRKASEEAIGPVRTWRLEYKEHERPTFIRNANRRDRPTLGSVWVDPATGEVWRTVLAWDDQPRGTITVTYGHVANIDELVPLSMSERYTPDGGTLTGDATYSKYRRFETGARLITEPSRPASPNP